MNNSQNGNNNSPFGMLNNNNNNNQVIPPTSNNNMNVQNPIPNSVNQQFPNQPVNNTTQQSNVVTLGTVSNVTYADTIGNIDYDADNSVKTEEPSSNQFINNNNTNNTLDQNNTREQNNNMLSGMNVDGAYNNMNVAPSYVSDPKVMEVLHPDENKKKTITINKELKTFFVIGFILLIFIFVLPIIFDLFNKVRFH